MLLRRCLWLVCAFVASAVSAAPTELRIAVDQDNSLATGCRVITNLGNVDGIDAILTTTYDGGVVTGVTKQTCLTAGTVDFTAPLTVDAGGWAVGTSSDGTLTVETRIPVSALPAGLRPAMRLAFIGVSGTSLETVLHDPDGEPILFPDSPERRRAVDAGGARVITLDGLDADWHGVEPLVSGLASTGGAGLRLLGGVRAWATAQSLYFVFSIQSNANAPTANDDGWTVLRGKTLHVSPPGVLGNDFDPGHRTLSASLVSGPDHGTLTFRTDGSFDYTNDGSPGPVDGFRYKAANGLASSNTAHVVLDLVDNRPPQALDDVYTVAHGGTLVITPPGVLSNDGDPDGDLLRPLLVGPPQHGAVTLNPDGSFTYVHDGSNTLADAFTYEAFDPYTSSNAATVAITIGPDAPPTALDDSYPLLEGATLVVPGLPGASLFTNDSDPDTPKSSFTAVITQQPAHGTLTPAAGGGFTYAHDGSETTADLFRYTVSDGILTSAAATVTLNIAPTDDAPVNAVPAPQSVAEEGVLTLSTAGGNAITVSDADAGLNSIQVIVSATNGTVALVATPGVSITGNGTASVTAQGPISALNAAMNGMQYTPTSNYFGAAQLTITSNDLGNSGAGGPQSATSNVAITVTPVNDAPSFTPGGDANSFEDTPYSAAWAGAVSAGPNESAQTPAFVVTSNDNLPLFASGPAISAAGLLTYTPAANASGSASITVVLGDNGGTAGGGVDTSGPQTFNINVTAVNDAPSFLKGANEVVDEDSGGHTVKNWATLISAGPTADETSVQSVNFLVSNDNNALFGEQPVIGADGTLSYAVTPETSGSATVTVLAHDDGGTANGGADTAAPQTFTITVNAVNDPPQNSVPEGMSTAEETPIAFTSQAVISVADVDANGGAESVSLTAANGTISVGSLPAGVTMTAGANDSTSLTISGTIADLNTALGNAVFTAALDFNGDATVTITTNDGGNTGSGGAQSDTDVITITVTPVNDPAVVLTADYTSTYTENGPHIPVAPSLIVVDPDNATLIGAVVCICGNADGPGNDLLEFDTTGTGITGNFFPNAGVLSLNGTGTLLEYQTVLRSIRFSSISEHPITPVRYIDFTVNDGSGPGPTHSAFVNVDSVNDAPVNSLPAGPLETVSNEGAFFSASISDADSTTAQVTLSALHGTITISGTSGLTFSAGDGTDDATMTFSGSISDINTALASIDYAPELDYAGEDTVTMTTDDQGQTGSGGAKTDTDTVTISIAGP
jgi:VCBS repeat-containing protein